MHVPALSSFPRTHLISPGIRVCNVTELVAVLGSIVIVEAADMPSNPIEHLHTPIEHLQLCMHGVPTSVCRGERRIACIQKAP